MASRTPSPTPQPPIPATPDVRATQLQRLYDDAVSHILKTCSYDNFASCFPTPAERVPASMVQLHAQFTAKLGQHMQREFAGILEERGVVGSLNQLDSLIREARVAKEKAKQNGMRESPVPPHTLPAEQLYLAHVAPLLKGPLQEMRSRQTALENENVELLNHVQQQRKEIEGLVKSLEIAMEDIESSVARLRDGPTAEALRNEIREAEDEMRIVH